MSELEDVLRAVEEARAAGADLALATVVDVRGSTYRREGARLLVPRQGRPVGTISGGCLEGDVREAAAAVMDGGVPRLLHFDLTAEDEAVWGWGLGCNGVVDVFVEPAGSAAALAAAIRDAAREGRDLVAVTVVAAPAGPTPVGARLLVHPDGRTDGSLGDGALDAEAGALALAMLAEDRSRTVPLGQGRSVFVEVIRRPLRLLVCGAGPDAVPLVRHGTALGWRVEVIDDREAFLSPRRFPQAARLVRSEPAGAAAAAGVDDRCHVVVMSHNFLRDRDYLRSFLGSPAPYIGMLGPAARLERLLAELRREGVEPDAADLEVVHGPAGLDLGADGPEEVAWAVAAEILAVRNGRSGGPLRDRPGPIHDRAPRTAAPAGG